MKSIAAKTDVLGKLLFIQQALDLLPDERVIGEFVARALLDIPGVLKTHVCLSAASASPRADFEPVCGTCTVRRGDATIAGTAKCVVAPMPGYRVFPLRTARGNYGYIPIRVGDRRKFSRYDPHIENMANTVANAVENRRYRDQLERANDGLERARESLERTIAERTAELAESEEKYRLIFLTNLDSVALVDAETMRFLDVNPAWIALYGHSRERALALTLADVSAAPEVTTETFRESVAAGEPVRIGLRWHRKRDGTTFPVEVSGGDFINRGRPVIWIVTRDITERKRAEESLRLQGDALNAAANIIVISDRNGTIEWVNAAYTALTGYGAEEAIGKKQSELSRSGVHDQSFVRDVWDTILAGHVWHGEVTNRRKDGSLYIVDMTITPVKSALGEIAHFIAIHQDLTERKQLEAQFLQAQKMESVGRLAGGVAHDFNNLLSVILGWTEMAMADLPAEHPIRPSLQEVLGAGHGAARLTKQLLAFSRQQLVEPTVFNVNDLVVGMQEMLRPLIGEDIEFVTRPGPDLATVKMDRGQFEQILMNLVVNARDAMPTGGTLTIETANVVLDAAYLRTHADVMPGEYVMLAVSDSGAGMNEEVKTHLFEPFFTTKERGKGTGLGLATCYGIVKQAGGHIAVDSVKGVGTTMKVYLPRRREAADAAVRGHKTMPVHGVETILLVEDEPAVRRVTTRMLEAQGYRVLSASSGAEALRVIEEAREPLQLLLTDVVLAGGMSGRVLADRVHALRPELKVLFASGYTSDVTILHGLLEQSVALVQKPFTAESLGEKVRRVLDAG
jgi:PAS domain S-box-containing protein